MHSKGSGGATLYGILLFAVLGGSVEAVEPQVITIGTGGVSGVYFPTGGAICHLVNKDSRQHGIRCSVRSTGGSIDNLNTIRAGNLDMGIVQSDTQYHAYNGTGMFAEQGPNKDLRALFSLHSEPLTVVARTYADIRTFADLKGKRVNIGNPGSGQRVTMDVLMAAKGWTREDFALATEWQAAEQSLALCDNQVDAIVYTVGHPNRSILEATTVCDSVIVEVSGAVVDKLLADNPYYTYAVIPGGMYRGNPQDVETFGVKATLVSSMQVPEETVYWTVRSVFENFAEFRMLHPALVNLNKDTMITDGNSAPLHPGAERYFREAGLLD